MTSIDILFNLAMRIQNGQWKVVSFQIHYVDYGNIENIYKKKENKDE